MIKIFISEWMKTKHTSVRWLVFLMPLVFAMLILWYFSFFSFRKITIELQMSCFAVFFEVWTVLALPLGTGLITGFMIHQEERAGGFNRLLGSHWPRRDLYFAKLAMLIFLTFTSTLLAVLAFAVGLWFLFQVVISWPAFIGASIMAIIATLPLIVFHLWISFAWGMGASIGIGGGGLFIAALMATSLGNPIWPFVPWAWPVRLTGLTGTYLFYLSGAAFPSQVADFVMEQAGRGLVPVGIFFVVMLAGSLIWFNRWEGRKRYES